MHFQRMRSEIDRMRRRNNYTALFSMRSHGHKKRVVSLLEKGEKNAIIERQQARKHAQAVNLGQRLPKLSSTQGVCFSKGMTFDERKDKVPEEEEDDTKSSFKKRAATFTTSVLQQQRESYEKKLRDGAATADP